MRRRSLLVLPLLAASPFGPAPGLAEPTAVAGTEASRLAGRQAIALAQAQRWPEAETAAQIADPLIRKYVTWLRLQQRGQAASAAELIGFALSNPEWLQPGPARPQGRGSADLRPGRPLGGRMVRRPCPAQPGRLPATG
ncbi:hypothetical protein [Dankookia sp. P2]|uniref:hypothetical protein n=1 Tax=Dankookia sp. P2 TaxID=3423955 RepID=UPI003D67AF0F